MNRTTARTLALVVLTPLLAAAVSIVAMLALAPAQVALHWGIDGVDRVGGIGELVALVAALVPSFTVLMAVAAVVALRSGTTRGYLRLLIVLSVAFGLAIAGGVLNLALAQRGVENVETLPVSTALLPLLIAAVAGIAIGGALSLLAPVLPVRATSLAPAAPLRLAPGESAYWSARVQSPAPVIALVLAAIVIVDVICVLAGLPLYLPVVYTLVLTALGSLLGWHVVVDSAGLRATGLLGFPVVRVRADEIAGVSVDTVRAFGDFAGWGVRVDKQGRWGLIVRSGPAIQVERVGTSPLVITVGDANNGAALLAAIAAKRP